MEPKLLDLYVKLQPEFREVYGFDWMTGDDYWCPRCYSKDTYHGNDELCCPSDINCQDGVIWIPRTIDYSSGEARRRSLWGMVDWNHYRFATYDDGEVMIFYVTEGLADQKKWSSGKTTPTEAILRAWCVQWEVE